MKIFFPLFVSLLIAGCSNQGNHSNNSVAADTPAKRSTSPVRRITPNPYAMIDVSPMDMAYFPVDFPIAKMSKTAEGQPLARVIYSRPHRQGRKIFGDLLKYGEPWRLGANEATELELFKDVIIQNKRINKGRYILYCIPQANSWTIVFNSNLYTWGLKPNPQKDLYKFQIPVQHSDISIEFFTMVFEPASAGANLLMAWDDVVARLPITFK